MTHIEFRPGPEIDPRGVNYMLSSESGRKRLAEVQKRHWKETLTPSDPRFKQIYGEKAYNNAIKGWQKR